MLCKSLLAGIADIRLWCFQSVQNSVARLVSRAWHHDHITPVLVNLHRLPVHKRVIFKTIVLVWKCLHSEAPSYLADLCVPVALTDGLQWLCCASDGPTNLIFSWSVDLRYVWAFYIEQTTSTSVIDEHNFTNILAQIEDIPVTVV